MKKNKKSIVSLFIVLIMSCVTMFAFGLTASANTYDDVSAAAEIAKGETIQPMIDTSSIESLLTDIRDNLQKIALIIAGIAVVALALVLITGGSQGLQKAKGFAISILVGIIVLALGVSLVASIYNAV